jgi:glycosyltransferase involved in cell wall biosynthesis
MNLFLKKTLAFLVLALGVLASLRGEDLPQDNKKVLLAILAKNKAHVLPKFLDCIDKLEYNKKLITLYINTNNNSDNTKEMLESWVQKNGASYASVIFESHHVAEDKQTKPHEWTAERFKVLGNIRNKSMQKTKEAGCDYYFVVDCDNFITPCTLRTLLSKDKPIIAPMLRAKPEAGDCYSNYFCNVTENGYYAHHDNYMKILTNEMHGTFEAPVVHCTYLIKAECIDKLTYVDNTNDYEFVIFSRSARKNTVGQYICNEKDFGFLVHFYDDISLEEEKNRVKDLVADCVALGA